MRKMKRDRVLHDWSQRKLAEESGVDVSYINRAEKWGSRMYPQQEKKVMDALNFKGDASELYEEVTTDGNADE